VTFGGIVAPAASYNSGTGQVTALAPAAPGPGPVDVRVSTALGSSPVSDAAEFTYLAAKPVITEISPNTGSVFGGDVVTIRGVGFLGTVCPGDILFGTQVVQSCTVVNDTTIQLTTPAGQSGPTVVVITSANGTSDIVELFTYTKVTGGGGGGGGGGGAGDGGTPQPGTGEQVSYLLYPGWNTVTWRGPDDIAINAALADADGNSLEFAITEIHVLNMDTSTYLIYAPAQSMFQFGFLQRDTVYWFRNTSNVVVTLVTTDQ
jgi:hypothetical protein